MSFLDFDQQIEQTNSDAEVPATGMAGGEATRTEDEEVETNQQDVSEPDQK